MPLLKKTLDRILYVIVTILFAALVVIVVWQVFSRQVLNDPSTWTEEGARITFVWLGLFAAALVFGERGHVAVEFLVRKLPDNSERAVATFVQVVILAFAVIVFIYGGYRASQNAWNQELSALPFTMGQMYLALPISGVLIAFYSIYYIIGMALKLEEAYGDHSDEDVEVALDPETAEAARAESELVDPVTPRSPDTSKEA